MVTRWQHAIGIANLAVGAASCGSSSNGSTSDFAGTYNATYSGTYVVNSPAGTPGGSSTSSGTITVTNLPNGQIGITFTIPPNPASGVIDFDLSGSSGMAVGPATGGQCFAGDVNGNTQTNCCSQCSITFSGNGTFTQPNAGTFTGVTPDGATYAGTYSGTWVGTKQ
jgi:hypothetical protein